MFPFLKLNSYGTLQHNQKNNFDFLISGFRPFIT